MFTPPKSDRGAMAEALSLLLAAPSKELVQKIFTHVFLMRDDIGKANVAKFAALFAQPETVGAEEVGALFAEVERLISSALYTGAASAEQVTALLPPGVDPKLQGLIVKIMVAHLPGWREAATLSMVSLPNLVDVNWRVDMKAATEHVGRMAVPAVLVDLKVRTQPTKQGVVPGVENVSFELSKEALDTMVEGLGRIRDQLSSINQ